MSVKTFHKITNKQITEKGVQSLADKPNLVGQYGESGLTAFQLKLRFDKLASFLAERINEIIEALSSDLAGQYIRVCLDEHKITNVDELINSFSDGSFAENVLKLLPSAGATQAIALQGIINSFAENISKIQENKLDKITTPSTENRVYGISPTGKDTAFAVSSNPIGGAIPLLDSDARLAVETPKKSTDAVNKDYSDEQDKKLGAFVEFSLDTNTYVLTLNLKNSTGDILSTAKIDFPMESVVVGGSFDEATSEIVLVLKNGNEIRFPVSNIVGGFISDKEFEDFLATKGQPNGFAGLDENGKVPKEQLPAGSGGGDINPDEYVKITDYPKPNKAGAIKAYYAYGIDITSDGTAFISSATADEIKAKTSQFKPITPIRGDYFLKVSMTTNTEEWTDEDKAAACKTIGAVGKTDLSEIYDILDLAGVTETIETTSTYDVRDTAQVGDSTLFVIPDTPTSVTKVEGNSAATDNMLNVYALQDTDYYRVRVEDMGEEIVFTGLITADAQLVNLGNFSDLIPTAKIGDILYIYAGPTNAAFPGGLFYLGSAETWQANGISPLTVTKEILDGTISVTFTLKENRGMCVQNFCVAKHTLNRNNWTPFFTGLKSAAFNGITSSSKNLWNDSVNTWTKTSTTSTKTLYKSNWIEIPVGVKNLATSIDGAGIMMEIYGVKVGNTEYTLSGNSTGYSYVHLKNTGYYGEGITAVKLGVHLPTDTNTDTNIADIKTQIEIGDEVTEYVPYVSSKLLFPEIENPFGQTIDFANKKVLNYGVEITLTGEESIRGSNDPVNGSVIIESILPTNELQANFISNFFVDVKSSIRGACWVGRSTKGISYLGGAYELGFIDENETTPTSEQLTSAAASFKAWLAKRYADGNPIVIRYISNVLQSSRDMTAEEIASGNTYMPIAGGIEYQKDNSSAIYGANNTVTQEYDMYRKLGGA